MRAQIFRFGYRNWPTAFSRRAFVAWSVLVFAVGFVLQVLFEREFGTSLGARYSAFLQNLLMSVLFINLFVQRREEDPVVRREYPVVD